ncbi:MAG: DUF177 domain-containing protein [Alphaproteobacteria bacterium]|nr:DUF177 domain-containing protein [Alphaproteobacteria bacterium]
MEAAMSKKNPPIPELSRPIDTESMPVDIETCFEVHANADERAALAKRFDLIGLDSLIAGISMIRSENGLVRLSGQLKADVVQACVVTLEPVQSTIETEFARSFSPVAVLEDQEEIVLIPEEEDPPEPLEGGILDAGEIVAESLSLALDPFPRAPGATLLPLADTPLKNGNNPDRSGPFSALAKLKKQR